MKTDKLVSDLNDLRQLLLYSGYKRTERRADGVDIYTRGRDFPYYLPSRFDRVTHAERARLALCVAAEQACTECGILGLHAKNCSTNLAKSTRAA